MLNNKKWMQKQQWVAYHWTGVGSLKPNERCQTNPNMFTPAFKRVERALVRHNTETNMHISPIEVGFGFNYIFKNFNKDVNGWFGSYLSKK